MIRRFEINSDDVSGLINIFDKSSVRMMELYLVESNENKRKKTNKQFQNSIKVLINDEYKSVSNEDENHYKIELLDKCMINDIKVYFKNRLIYQWNNQKINKDENEIIYNEEKEKEKQNVIIEKQEKDIEDKKTEIALDKKVNLNNLNNINNVKEIKSNKINDKTEVIDKQNNKSNDYELKITKMKREFYDANNFFSIYTGIEE